MPDITVPTGGVVLSGITYHAVLFPRTVPSVRALVIQPQAPTVLVGVGGVVESTSIVVEGSLPNINIGVGEENLLYVGTKGIGVSGNSLTVSIATTNIVPGVAGLGLVGYGDSSPIVKKAIQNVVYDTPVNFSTSGIVKDDLVLLFSWFPTPSVVPSDFRLLVKVGTEFTNGFSIWVKRATDSEPGTYSIGNNSTFQYTAAIMVVVSGQNKINDETTFEDLKLWLGYPVFYWYSIGRNVSPKNENDLYLLFERDSLSTTALPSGGYPNDLTLEVDYAGGITSLGAVLSKKLGSIYPVGDKVLSFSPNTARSNTATFLIKSNKLVSNEVYTIYLATDLPVNLGVAGISPTVDSKKIYRNVDGGSLLVSGEIPLIYIGLPNDIISYPNKGSIVVTGSSVQLFYPPATGVLSFTGYDPGTGWEVPDPYSFTLSGLQPIASIPKVPGANSLTFTTYVPDVWPYWDYPDQANLVLGTNVPIVGKGVFVTPLPKANITIEVSSIVDVYTVFAQIQVEVVDIYTDIANITVEVTNVVDVYTVTASITIAVVELAYTLTAPIVVDVVPLDAYADGGSWRPVVIVNSVDVSAYCYGNIDIEINEGESAIADLEFIAGVGPINLVSWNGKPVVVDYAKKDSNGNAIYNRRIFTGIVDTPSYDIINGRLKLRCTTDLQNYCRRVGRTVLDGIIGGRYSDAVFDSTVDDWEYTQDRVSTVLGNVDFDVYRNLRLISWESKVSPDITLTESTIIDGSLSVNFAARRDIINKVNVTMNYQFPRLKKRVMTIGFNYPFSLSEILLNGYTVPTRQMIKDAIRNSGWEIAAKIGWTPVPEGPLSVNLGGAYGKTGVWLVNDSNLNGIVKKPPTKPGANDQVVVYPVATGDKDAADKLCFGYTAFVRKRYAQNIKETYEIVVKNDFSIGKLGELIDKLEAGIDVDFDVGSWESWRPPSNPEDETISSVESGLPGAVAFQASAPYVAGQVVRPSSGENGFKYLVTVGGITASEPTWPTKSGSTVKSGTVTFKAVYQTASGADLEPEPVVPDPKVGESYIDYEGGVGEDRTALGNAITTLIDMGKRIIYGSHRKTVVKCKVPINPDLDCSKTVRVQTTHFVCKGKVKKVHHVMDMDSGEATSEIEIAILIVDGTGFPKETTTTVPPKPEVTLQEGSSEIFIPTISGATHQRVWVGAAWYSGPLRKDMYGYMTNVAKFTQDWKEGAPIYPVQYSVLMPGIDDESRDLNTASVGSVYEANLVEDEFVVS